MTRILATDENNDIFIGKDGRLAIHGGLDAVMQACEHAVTAQLGEMQYAVDRGIPTFTTIWNGTPNLGQFEAAVRQAILAVADVTQVTAFSAEVVGNVVRYTASIETIYGTGVVNG